MSTRDVRLHEARYRRELNDSRLRFADQLLLAIGWCLVLAAVIGLGAIS